jgi:hypothetical protein
MFETLRNLAGLSARCRSRGRTCRLLQVQTLQHATKACFCGHTRSRFPLASARETPLLPSTMKKVPCFRILNLGGCLAALALLAGCFETRQEFTLNPDGSGKVLHESKFQTVDLSGGKPGSEKQLKAAVAEIIGKARGVDAWRDVSYSLLDDGRIAFKGTAYFRSLSTLDIPNQTMLEFDWAGSGGHSGVLSLRAKEGENKGKAKTIPANLPAGELAQKVKESRAKYQQMKPMMAMIVGAMKHEVVFHLPGKPAKSSAFQTDPTGALSLRFDGGKMLNAMEALINDDVWMALNSGSLNPDSAPPMDEAMSQLLFGDKGPVRATVSDLGGAAFDYEAEVAAAKEAFASLQQQLGTTAVAIAPPARGGELKSLKVVGMRLVHATDEQLEIQPLNTSPGYTLALLAELPGSVHAISDESGLDSAIASDGTDLLPESEFKRHFSFPKLSADKASVLIEAEMTAPGPGVTGLKELAGHLRYTVAGATTETDLGFARLVADAKGKELGAEIKSVGEKSDEGSQSIEMQLDLEPDTLKALYLVTGNEKIELEQRGYSGGGGTYVFTYESATGVPPKSRLVAETYAQMETYDTPFKLENITLLGEPVEAK